MTDRELLELAAKAAGFEYECVSHTGYSENDQHQIRNSFGTLIDWNPLDDDGDALRLAVKLKATIFNARTNVIAELDSDCDEPPIAKKEYCDDETRLAATRRAIVRAAAEIGRNMK